MLTDKKINNLANSIHQTAVEKGWWEDERNHDEIFMLIITELSEAVEADREGRVADIEGYKECLEVTDFPKTLFEDMIKDTIEDELADTIIRCLDYMYFLADTIEVRDMDIDWGDNFAANIFYICKVISYEDIPSTVGFITSLADHMNIDLEWYIKQKMRYNGMREYKHGNKKY